MAVLACGAKVLAEMLAELATGRREEAVACSCGHRMESQGVRGKELLTILGPVAYERSMFKCPACRATRYPGDEALDSPECSAPRSNGTSATPRLSSTRSAQATR